jgi:hypothetical protein
MKQTAVDWLIGQLYAPCRGIPSHIIEQAKEMEKEQMCNFVEYCQIEHSKYQETEASWIKELTIDDLFEKRYTK